MRAPAIALLWELWRRNRWGNIAVLAVIPICAALYGLEAHLRGGAVRMEFIPPGLIPMFISLLWVFCVFGFTESDSRRGFTGIPARIFALPVRTVTVVTWLTVAAVCAICGLYLIWAKVVFAAAAGFPLPLLFPMAVLATSIVFFQATVWGLASFPWIRVIVLVGGAAGFIVVNAIGISEDNLWNRSESFRALCVLAFLPVAYVAALFGVQAERCGGWHLWARVRVILRPLISLIPRREAAFRSRASAQLWFEWRRKGWFVSGGMAAGFIGVGTLLPIAVLAEAHAPFSLVVLANFLFMPLVMARAIGLGLGKCDFWARENGLSTYRAVQPVTTAELVFAKLKVTGLVMLFSIFFAAPVIWAIQSSSNWQDFWRVAEITPKFVRTFSVQSAGPMLLGGIAALAITVTIWHSMAAGLSLSLTGRLQMINVRSIGGGILLFEIAWFIHWLSDNPQRLREWLPVVYGAAGLVTIWKIFRTLRAFREVTQRKLISGEIACRLLVLWLMAGVSAIALGWIVWLCTPRPQAMLCLAAASLFPSAALFQSILNLVSNRHQ